MKHDGRITQDGSEVDSPDSTTPKGENSTSYSPSARWDGTELGALRSETPTLAQRRYLGRLEDRMDRDLGRMNDDD